VAEKRNVGRFNMVLGNMKLCCDEKTESVVGSLPRLGNWSMCYGELSGKIQSLTLLLSRSPLDSDEQDARRFRWRVWLGKKERGRAYMSLELTSVRDDAA
jgi:hypothetical protein